MVKSTRKSARDRILEKASELFYQEGIQKVGIDRIIAESGVAKMSLYNHFKSKDVLIAEVLKQRDESWRSWFIETLASYSSEPKERLLAIFDVLKLWFEQPNFRGCAFINATIELGREEHPAYQIVLRHKQSIYSYILELVKASQLKDPESLARQLFLLIEGAIVVAMREKKSTAAEDAKVIAQVLLTRES
ncbi:MAG: TetR/AcrR family transcriptional regulator [Cyanobacteria bacterium J083]|nr:MAG: TetR/AcrR family transcriptional regulator [Cyanobacteria bacterium J083]